MDIRMHLQTPHTYSTIGTMKEIATATVRLYPSTRRKLKVLAAQKSTSLAQVVASMV